MQIEKTAKELLATVMQSSQWYKTANGDVFDRRHAAVTKSNLKKGILSTDKCVEILEKLGWSKITHVEVWSKKDS